MSEASQRRTEQYLQYGRRRRSSSPTIKGTLYIPRTVTPEERLLAKVVPEPNSGCHLWIGAVNGDGYGSFRLNGKIEKAHRAAWRLFVGPIADNTVVLHKCDNPPCVNTDHHFLGSQSDNMRDMVAKGRSNSHYAARKACKYGHEFTPENTRITPIGSRDCRECGKRRSRAIREARANQTTTLPNPESHEKR